MSLLFSGLKKSSLGVRIMYTEVGSDLENFGVAT